MAQDKIPGWNYHRQIYLVVAGVVVERRSAEKMYLDWEGYRRQGQKQQTDLWQKVV